MLVIRKKILVVIVAVVCLTVQAAESDWSRTESRLADGGSRLVIAIVDADSGQARPARVVITAADGSHPDGSGKGVYADGRFFVEGGCQVDLPVGPAEVKVDCGPHYLPVIVKFEQAAATESTLTVRMQKWFSPRDRGWYCGDNHVHAQHDETKAAVATDLGYTALQARANGLDYITEAGSHVVYTGLKALSNSEFLFRHVDELRPGIFAGHLITPGMRRPLPEAIFEQLRPGPLTVQLLLPEVHKLGGVMIHTHTMTPRHQLHWMGAAELWCDAVQQRCADGVDVDSPSTELLYFAALNLGNRIAVSSYTDAALGRAKTLSPGDRRVYSRSRRFDYDGIVDGIRRGETFATDGGPVFPFLTVQGQGPGAEVLTDADGEVTVTVEVFSRDPLATVEVVQNGVVATSLRAAGQCGRYTATLKVRTGDASGNWLLLRARDLNGHWGITSPVYTRHPDSVKAAPAPAACVLAEINNTRRTYRLSRDFFMHALVSVSPGLALRTVELQRDGESVQVFCPAPRIPGAAVAVTAFGEDYAPGVDWVVRDGRAVHCQFDWPVAAAGSYRVVATTEDGRLLQCDGIRFDPDRAVSHELSSARLVGPGTELVLHGYGEEMALVDVRSDDTGDHWWYPGAAYSLLQGRFYGSQVVIGPWGKPPAADAFTASGASSAGFGTPTALIIPVNH